MTPGASQSPVDVDESGIHRPNGIDPSPLVNVGHLYCAGYKLGDINLFHGIPFLTREGQKWIGFRTEDHDASGESHGPLWQNQRQTWATAVLPENSAPGAKDLPPQDIAQRYLNYYRSSDLSSLFPFADPVMFPETIEKAYNSNASSTSDILPARACVLSFLALVSILSIAGDQELPSIDASGCVTAAQCLMPDILDARASTETVDALMMLVSRLSPTLLFRRICCCSF